MAFKSKRHAFGQHFLKDTSVISRIVESFVDELKRDPCPAVLEIGPGKGALTKPLLEALHREFLSEAPQVILAEKDRVLAEEWRGLSVATPVAFQVLEGDFLEQTSESWSGAHPVAVISNLPYSTGTPIMKKLLEARDRVPFLVLMFQAEVGKRLRAGPSEEGRGSLSLWVQNLWDVSKVCTVKPQAFRPPPKVMSEVVLLRRRQEPRIRGSQEHPELWQALIKQAFAQPRKMLRGNLSGEPWKSALAASGVDGSLRAGALDWAQWQSLFDARVSQSR